MGGFYRIGDNERMDALRAARTDTYKHTISGLLRRRAEMLGEAKVLRERLAVVTNAIVSLDEVLHAFGYEGDLETMRPKGVNRNGFARNKLRRFLLDELRKAKEPVTIRKLTEIVMASRGMDMRDLHLLQDTVRKVRRGLQTLERHGTVRGRRTQDVRGQTWWELAQE